MITTTIDSPTSIYFKYTSGESYTLNNLDYFGLFHIDEDGIAYTGPIPSSSAVKLSQKSTFFSEVHQNKIELNTTFKNIDPLMDFYVNVYDNFNKDGLVKLTNTLNYNNLMCFKSLMVDNPTIYNFNPSKNHFYGIENLPSDNSNVLEVINTPSIITKFDIDPLWAFLSKIIHGILLVNDDNTFYYICSTGTDLYTLSGDFSNLTPLGLISKQSLIDSENADSYDYIFNIEYDKLQNKLTLVKSDTIEVYDAKNYLDCSKLFLIDRIQLEYKRQIELYMWGRTKKLYSKSKIKWTDRYNVLNLNNSNTIKFGANLRTTIIDNTLYLYNKYSPDIVRQINLTQHGVVDILDLAIRTIDDSILILHRHDTKLYVLFINAVDPTKYKNSEIFSVTLDSDWYKIKFSDYDSDIFYISTPHEYQTRHISYMTYPTGRLESGYLLYRGDEYIWNETVNLFNNIDITWNFGNDDENKYTNILTSEYINHDNMYILLHNAGRLYAIYQPLSSRFYDNIDHNLEKLFTGVNCSESSIGLFLNTIISNMVTDTLTLYNNSFGKYQINELGLIDNPLDELVSIQEDINNLYLNGNESFNALAIQRIFLTLKKIQSTLISTSKT